MPVLRTSASDFTAWNRANAVLPTNGKAAKSTDTTVDRKAAAVVAIGSMSAIGATPSSAISKRWRNISSFVGYAPITSISTNTVSTLVTTSRLGAGGRNLVCDSNGTMFFIDINSNTFTKITPSGVATAFSVSGASLAGNFLQALTIDQTTNNMYVAGHTSGNFFKITPEGVVSLLATSTGLSQPFQGIVHPTNGDIYMPNSGSGIVKITQAGVVSTFSSVSVYAIAFDSSKTNIIGFGGINPAVVRTIPLSTGTPINVNSTICNVPGGCLDKTGTYFIGADFDNTIKAIPGAGGPVITVAGTGTVGSQDGPAGSATFAINPGSYYSSQALLPDGTIAIVDSVNLKIRIITVGSIYAPLIVYYR